MVAKRSQSITNVMVLNLMISTRVDFYSHTQLSDYTVFFSLLWNQRAALVPCINTNIRTLYIFVYVFVGSELLYAK